jgi:hypothetical protein
MPAQARHASAGWHLPQQADSSLRWNDSTPSYQQSNVMPAQAGTSHSKQIPACAGMTVPRRTSAGWHLSQQADSSLRWNDITPSYQRRIPQIPQPQPK